MWVLLLCVCHVYADCDCAGGPDLSPFQRNRKPHVFISVSDVVCKCASHCELWLVCRAVYRRVGRSRRVRHTLSAVCCCWPAGFIVPCISAGPGSAVVKGYTGGFRSHPAPSQRDGVGGTEAGLAQTRSRYSGACHHTAWRKMMIICWIQRRLLHGHRWRGPM